MKGYRRVSSRYKVLMGSAGTITSSHFVDEDDNPAGGSTGGVGFSIAWQNGPLGRGEDRIEANGAFVEDVLMGVIDRMEWYQESKFRCRENALVITKLEEALHWMEHRTKDREVREVEGLHQV